MLRLIIYLIMNIINRRLILRLTNLATRNQFPFSKNPFDKFQRNKGKQSQHSTHQNQNKNQSETYQQKQKKIENESRPQAESKQDHMRQKQDKKEVPSEQQKGHLQHQNKRKEAQNHANMQNDEEAIDANRQSSQANKGFQRFLRRPKKEQSVREIKQKEKELKKKEQKINAAKAAEHNEKKNEKKEIPTIKIQLTKEDLDQKSTLRLRKPKNLLKKNKDHSFYKQEQAKPEESTSSQQMEKHHGQQEKPAPIDIQEEKKWEEFQSMVEMYKKKSIFYSNPRYKRENLLKENVQKAEHSESTKPPSDLKQYLIRLVAAGLGLMLVSSSDYFNLSKGKEVSPDYLKESLESGRIEETWFQNVEVQTNTDERVKGKNIHKYVYILENTGQLCFCVSNYQFENIWLEMVVRHNQHTDLKTPQMYQLPTGEMVNKSEVPPKKVKIGETRELKNSSTLSSVKSVLSLILLYYFIKSITQIGKIGRAKGGSGKGISGLLENQKSYRLKEAIPVTFKDVVGMQKAKQEIVEFIDFLQRPEKYNRLGARIPKGALLTGPPGTGKTMLAKACAGQSKVPFFTISGSEFIEMYVGVGAQRVRNLFQEAKTNAPSIIFIDQIDAVGKKRTGGFGGGGNDERDTTLNQLLVEMDGFDSTTNVIVFAATNQKEVLDAALTRPGRFDRLIDIDLPDLEGRKEIFQVHLKPLVLDRHIYLGQYAKRLATLTPGFSGADIKNVCNEAAIIAARNNKESVSIMDFELATQRIIGGVQKKSQLITEETRKTVAYHECGHGVVSWFLQHSSPLLKLTIIPRSKGALGFAQYLPSEHQMYTKAKLLDEICVILGGRMAEEVFFGKISTGASDDLNKAYQVAKTLVTQYGFGDLLGWQHYDETEYAKEYSKEIEDKIDTQIMEIMRICGQRTRSIVKDKKDLIGKLAQRLLELETIDQTVIEDVLGQRPFALSKQHEQYVREKKRMAEDIRLQGQKNEALPEAEKTNMRSNMLL